MIICTWFFFKYRRVLLSLKTERRSFQKRYKPPNNCLAEKQWKKRMKKKNEKCSNTNKKYLFTFTFLYRNIYNLLRDAWNSSHCYICITVFTVWQFIGSTVIKHQYTCGLVLWTPYFYPKYLVVDKAFLT